jgi:cyclase
MLKTRVIPCLLLKNSGLVKTVNFKNSKYIGDPINCVRIFNDKEVDELIFLDIKATMNKKPPQFELINNISSECFMPFGYGGGIADIETAKKIFKLGAEKVIVNSSAVDFEFIKEASSVFGSQSVVAAIDVKKNWMGKYQAYTHSGTKNTKMTPLELAQKAETMGAGEIFINSIDKEGTMSGYDIELIKLVSMNVDIPVVAAGGAGKLQDFSEAVKVGGASAVAAGSLFVYQGPHKAVLINYPTQDELKDILF